MANENWPIGGMPWREAGPTTGIDDLFVEDADGIVIARIGRDMSPERRARLRALVVALPELYEALEYAYPFVRYCQHEHMADGEGNESEKSIAVEKIVNVLLKANPTRGTDAK